MSTSWSDREKSSGVSAEKLKDKIHQVNGVLRHLANDSNLQDDLRDPAVKVAIQHWTGEKRLPPNSEELLHFQDNYRVMSTLGKIQQLQASCRSLGIAVPFDHVILRKTELDLQFLAAKYGLRLDSEQTPNHEVRDVPAAVSSKRTGGGVGSPPQPPVEVNEPMSSNHTLAARELPATDMLSGKSYIVVIIICILAFAFRYYRERS